MGRRGKRRRVNTRRRPEASLQLPRKGVMRSQGEVMGRTDPKGQIPHVLKLRGHGDKLDVTGRERKKSMVICIIKLWYLGFALLLPVLTYLANQNNSTDKQV